MLIGINKRSETIVFHRALAIADLNLGSGTARHQSLASGSRQLSYEIFNLAGSFYKPRNALFFMKREGFSRFLVCSGVKFKTFLVKRSI